MPQLCCDEIQVRLQTLAFLVANFCARGAETSNGVHELQGGENGRNVGRTHLGCPQILPLARGSPLQSVGGSEHVLAKRKSTTPRPSNKHPRRRGPPWRDGEGQARTMSRSRRRSFVCHACELCSGSKALRFAARVFGSGAERMQRRFHSGRCRAGRESITIQITESRWGFVHFCLSDGFDPGNNDYGRT